MISHSFESLTIEQITIFPPNPTSINLTELWFLLLFFPSFFVSDFDFLGLVLHFSRLIVEDELFGQYFLKAKCNVILPERVCPPFRR